MTPDLFVEPLTDRQRQILRLVSYGLEQDEIAARLHISRYTVKKHKEQIRERLGARNTANAVAIAYEYGVWA